MHTGRLKTENLPILGRFWNFSFRTLWIRILRFKSEKSCCGIGWSSLVIQSRPSNDTQMFQSQARVRDVSTRNNGKDSGHLATLVVTAIALEYPDSPVGYANT